MMGVGVALPVAAAARGESDGTAPRVFALFDRLLLRFRTTRGSSRSARKSVCHRQVKAKR
jgi:hypothetical protein